jgi:hypothetical protein
MPLRIAFKDPLGNVKILMKIMTARGARLMKSVSGARKASSQRKLSMRLTPLLPKSAIVGNVVRQSADHAHGLEGIKSEPTKKLQCPEGQSLHYIHGRFNSVLNDAIGKIPAASPRRHARRKSRFQAKANIQMK